jgi:cell division protein FtsN
MGTRDYKTRERNRSTRGRRGCSGFFWFITGAVLGGFGVGLAWMLQERLPTATRPNPRNEASAPTKPRFDFHQILPEMEVLVPDEELSTTSRHPPGPPAAAQQQKVVKPAKPGPAISETATKPEKRPSATDATSYLVQVGSFGNSADAERVKAKLALLGVQARIQRVTVNGKPYHRVRAGPFQGKQQVNKTRALLSSRGLESITIRLK